MKTEFMGLFFIIAVIFGSCDSTTKKEKSMDDQNNTSLEVDNTPRVTGIGGVFFLSDDPQKTTKWYEENLGLVMDEYGAVFEFRNANRPDELNYLRWSVSNGKEFFEPSQQTFMINYRVQNIEGLVEIFNQNGVTVLDSIASYPYGKFVHILDPEGNKIQLWEPVDSVLTGMRGKTTK